MSDGITFSHKGGFGKTYDFLRKSQKSIQRLVARMEQYGPKGVNALREATPKDTGVTADSWVYEIKNPAKGIYCLEWDNTNIVNGYAKVAILIQYGHATGNGAYVQGIDYINPAMRPIFEEMAANCWKEVSGS